MQFFLKNESDKSIIIELDNMQITLIPDSGKYVEAHTSTVALKVYADEKYRSEPVTSTLGLRCFHRFVAVSAYTVTLTDNCTIRFYKETAHGNNLESYTRIYPHSTACSFSAPHYTVKDEAEIKEKLARSDKNEAVILQGAGIAGKLIKAKNTFDDIVAALILGAVALVVFILLCVFTGFGTAVLIYGLVAAAGLFIRKCFLEEALKKAKSKAKAKAEQKVEKAFLPCDNMPEGIFKGKASYFSNEYITAVFKHSKKRI